MPAGQVATHANVPAGAQVLKSGVALRVEHGAHDDAVAPLEEPEGHGAHVEDAAEAEVPGAQGVQANAAVPAGQIVHAAALVLFTGLKYPLLHMTVAVPSHQ